MPSMVTTGKLKDNCFFFHEMSPFPVMHFVNGLFRFVWQYVTLKFMMIFMLHFICILYFISIVIRKKEDDNNFTDFRLPKYVIGYY